jgi:hypothetical protein
LAAGPVFAPAWESHSGILVKEAPDMRTGLFLAIMAIAASAAAAPADEQAPPSIQRPAPDFLFGRPRGSAGLRGSWFMARAGSDWYRFVTDTLTLENRDFNAPALGVDVGVALTRRLDAVFALEYGRSRTGSEYRHFVDNNRLPITQETTLQELNLSGGVKLALTERGREVSRFAWVPRRMVPYVGAGGGMLWFDLNQSGDFVDYVDYRVFTDAFSSRGWTPSAHVFGGVDLRVFRRLLLTFDGRYLWSAGQLGTDWIDFDPLDLAGLRLSAGFSVLF